MDADIREFEKIWFLIRVYPPPFAANEVQFGSKFRDGGCLHTRAIPQRGITDQSFPPLGAALSRKKFSGAG
jgi:hypothetical protein